MKEKILKIADAIERGWNWICENWFDIEPYNVELTISNPPETREERFDLEGDLLDEGTDCEVTRDGKVRTYSKYYKEVKRALYIFGHDITMTEVMPR